MDEYEERDWTDERIEAIIESDPRDPATWCEDLKRELAGRQNLTPFADSFSHDNLEDLREDIVKEAAFARAEVTEVRMDLLSDILRDSFEKQSIKFRVFSELADAGTAWVSEVADACIELTPKLDAAWPRMSVSDILRAIGCPRAECGEAEAEEEEAEQEPEEAEIEQGAGEGAGGFASQVVGLVLRLSPEKQRAVLDMLKGAAVLYSGKSATEIEAELRQVNAGKGIRCLTEAGVTELERRAKLASAEGLADTATIEGDLFDLFSSEHEGHYWKYTYAVRA